MDTLGTFPCFPAYRRNAYGAHARERCKAALVSDVSKSISKARPGDSKVPIARAGQPIFKKKVRCLIWCGQV
jgi:hypothetical protein